MSESHFQALERAHPGRGSYFSCAEKGDPMAAKERLDKLLVEQGFCESRQKAQALIMAGAVLVDDVPIDKAGTRVPIEAHLRLKYAPSRYVSRGGEKLEAALQTFSVALEGATAVDLGASTGGFTDCLLQHGCANVVAIDVGYGQLHPTLRQHPQVHSIERVNVRYLTREEIPLPDSQPIDLITADLSFISLHLILPVIASLLRESGDAIVLIKPQFEVGRELLPKGGVVRDPDLRQQCADRIAAQAQMLELQECARIDSPVHGPKGNIEILMHLKKLPSATPPSQTH